MPEELRLDGTCHECGGVGPVVIVQCDTDPGDMGEPTVPLASDAQIVDYVFEQDGLWFRPKRGTWHLSRPGKMRSWCGRDWRAADDVRTVPVTWPWPAFSCWSCMDRRWSRGIR